MSVKKQSKKISHFYKILEKRWNSILILTLSEGREDWQTPGATFRVDYVFLELYKPLKQIRCKIENIKNILSTRKPKPNDVKNEEQRFIHGDDVANIAGEIAVTSDVSLRINRRS